MTELVIARRVTGSNSSFSLQHIPFFNWRMRSLARGTALALAGIPIVLLNSYVPRSTLHFVLIVPLLLTILGTMDTARCMRKRWDFYHAGVLLLLYADLMAFFLLSFLLLYPYLPAIGT
jgi:hypothetical protein